MKHRAPAAIRRERLRAFISPGGSARSFTGQCGLSPGVAALLRRPAAAPGDPCGHRRRQGSDFRALATSYAGRPFNRFEELKSRILPAPAGRAHPVDRRVGRHVPDGARQRTRCGNGLAHLLDVHRRVQIGQSAEDRDLLESVDACRTATRCSSARSRQGTSRAIYTGAISRKFPRDFRQSRATRESIPKMSSPRLRRAPLRGIASGVPQRNRRIGARPAKRLRSTRSGSGIRTPADFRQEPWAVRVRGLAGRGYMRTAGIQRLQSLPGRSRRRQADPRKLLRHLYQLFGRARLRCGQSLPRRLHLPLADGLYRGKREGEFRCAQGAAGRAQSSSAETEANRKRLAINFLESRCPTARGSAATPATETGADCASRLTLSSSSRRTVTAFRPRPPHRPAVDRAGDGAQQQRRRNLAFWPPPMAPAVDAASSPSALCSAARVAISSRTASRRPFPAGVDVFMAGCG